MVIPHPRLSVVLSHYYIPLPLTVGLHLGNAGILLVRLLNFSSQNLFLTLGAHAQ